MAATSELKGQETSGQHGWLPPLSSKFKRQVDSMGGATSELENTMGHMGMSQCSFHRTHEGTPLRQQELKEYPE